MISLRISDSNNSHSDAISHSRKRERNELLGGTCFFGEGTKSPVKEWSSEVSELRIETGIETVIKIGIETGIETVIKIGIETEIETGIKIGIETGIETVIKIGIETEIEILIKILTATVVAIMRQIGYKDVM